MQRKMFQIIYFLNCNSKIWQEIIMRDNVWKLTDCAAVCLSFHDCNSWRIHPFQKLCLIQDTHVLYPSEFVGSHFHYSSMHLNATLHMFLNFKYVCISSPTRF